MGPLELSGLEVVTRIGIVDSMRMIATQQRVTRHRSENRSGEMRFRE